jgi:hypothetical protein
MSAFLLSFILLASALPGVGMTICATRDSVNNGCSAALIIAMITGCLQGAFFGVVVLWMVFLWLRASCCTVVHVAPNQRVVLKA